PSLRRHYPASTVLWASPTPPVARPVPRGRPVGSRTHRRGSPVLRFVLPVQTCQRHYPGGTVAGIGLLPGKRRRRPSPNVRGVGSRSPIISRPARRSRTFWPACSRSRLKRLLPSKASAVSLPPRPLRLLLAGATVARWDLHPLKNDAFHGARTYRNMFTSPRVNAP